MFWVKTHKWKCLCFLALFGTGSLTAAKAETEWLEKKGQHFIIQYTANTDAIWIQDMLSKADRYYRQVAERIGYSRYEKYWSWDRRVQIVIFPDKDSFFQTTGQPAWSRGGSAQYDSSLEGKVIVSYYQRQGFIQNVLPHEIAHLTLKDFVDNKSLPVWFEEGVAQLTEPDKIRQVHAYMKKRYQDKTFIPLNELHTTDVRAEKDPLKVEIYYAQSLSIIDYLIQTFGSQRFGQMCRLIRDGKNFKQALILAYKPDKMTLENLEQKWLNFLNSY